jgi:hexosaminidase
MSRPRLPGGKFLFAVLKYNSIRPFLFLFLFLAGPAIFACKKESTLPIIPLPQSIQQDNGQLPLLPSTSIFLKDTSLRSAAEYLNKRLQEETGFSLPFKTSPGKGGISLEVNRTLAHQEGYTLKVDRDGIEITGNDEAGAFYGIQTLLQIIREIPAKDKDSPSRYAVPYVRILDYPRFAWRGMHLDVARHFFSIDFIKKQLEIMARHKLNVFHWHLTDDQGWRIEIKKYPGLTEIGAWRADREDQPWDAREPLKAGERPSYGGFYTQDQIRDVVAYAKGLHITIVPEIEMPGHAVAALAAYPELSCSGEKVEVMPGAYWPITHIFCAGNDKTFEFIDDVIAEVSALFPSTFIHIGGDEASKKEWETCPKCRARMDAEHLATVKELEGYFFRKVEKSLAFHGRRLIGWDKVLDGGLTSDAAIMSWKGIRGGTAAAGQGHDVVMTPTEYMYFDFYQAESGEPPAIGGYLPLEKVYGFDPAPATMEPSIQKHVLGVQANVWTEYMQTEAHVEYMIFPRQCALAEVAWSQPGRKNYVDFLIRMNAHYKRLERWGVKYRKPDIISHDR